mgnify:FL=1
MYINTRTASEILGCSISHVRNLIRDGRLASAQDNGPRKHMYMEMAEVEALAAEQRRVAEARLQAQRKKMAEQEARLQRTRPRAPKVSEAPPTLLRQMQADIATLKAGQAELIAGLTKVLDMWDITTEEDE